MSNIQTFDYSANILRSLLWRNNNAPNTESLVQNKQNYFDSESRDFWANWAVDVFDLRTANEFGLNVWSIILDIPITISPVTQPNNSNFGFGSFRFNFGAFAFGNNNANFTGIDESTLNIEDARRILRLRYYQLTTNANVTAINFLLNDVFGDLGTSHVEDNLDMTMVYVFDFELSGAFQVVMTQFDLLPRPAGVALSYTTV